MNLYRTIRWISCLQISRMPYMDGMELSRFSMIPSGHRDRDLQRIREFEYAKAIQYGVSEYMLKPVTAMEPEMLSEKNGRRWTGKVKEKEKLETSDTNSRITRKRHCDPFQSAAGLVRRSRHGRKSLEELGCIKSILRQSIVWLFLIWICIRRQSRIAEEKRQESALMFFVLLISVMRSSAKEKQEWHIRPEITRSVLFHETVPESLNTR